MPKPYHGSCLCKEVGFEVNADPVTVSMCHCTNCKKFTGTAFTTNVVFPANSARITKGQVLVNSYYDADQDSRNPLTRLFCSRCASPLYITGGDAGSTLSTFYSALDDFDDVSDGGKPDKVVQLLDEVKEETRRWITAVVPRVEYYTKDRLHWVAPVAGAEQASTKPGRE